MTPRYNRKAWLIVSMIFLQTPKLCAAGGELEPLFGQWEVTAVRLDRTLMRTPAYNIDDPELMGRYIIVSGDRITTNMPEETTCQSPHTQVEISPVTELVDRTMTSAAR